jgi:succinoglycan biosynthesis transport protein ExoP
VTEMSGSQTGTTNSLNNAQIGIYLQVARRRKWWIILCSLGLFIAATVFASRLPNIYRAETMILVDSAQVPNNIVPAMNTGDLAGRLATLQQQVLSPTRLKKLVRAEGLYPDPIKNRTEEQVVHSVQSSIVVEMANVGAGKLSAFKIGFSSPRRNEVARIANHLAQMFIEENLAVRVNQAEDTAKFLGDQLEETKKELNEKDAELRAIKSRNTDELPDSKPYHLETLVNLRAQVQTIQTKIQQDQREKGILETMLVSGEDAPTVNLDGGGEGGNSDPYNAQIIKLETKLADLKTHYGSGHPDVRRTEDEIAKLKAKAAAEKASAPAEQQQQAIAPAVQQTTKRRNPVLEAQLQSLNEDIKEQTSLLQPLQAQMAMHESKLQQIPAFEQQIARLQQDYEALRIQYMGLLDKQKSSEISYALEVHQKGEKFEILDQAVTPNSPAAPNRRLISLAGLFGGLLAGIALAGIFEMHDESVRTENEAARIVGKPVLSWIPRIASPQQRRAALIKTVAMVAGTCVGSVGIGFLLSFVAGGLF